MKKRTSNIAVGMLATAVAVGTFVVLLLPPPEDVVEISADGNFRIEGRGPADLSILIERLETTPGPVEDVRGPVYAVGFRAGDAPPLTVPTWTLSLAYDEKAIAREEIPKLVLLRFDETQAAWKVYPTIVDTALQQLSVEIRNDPGGLWAVGVSSDLSGG